MENSHFNLIGLLNAKGIYTVVDEALTKVNVLRGYVYLLENTVRYVVELPNGDVKELEKDAQFYRKPEDFKRGETLDGDFYITAAEIFRRLGLNAKTFEGGSIEPHAWIMKDGEPADIAVSVSNVVFNITKFKAKVTDENGNSLTDYYPDRETCLRWNEYKVVDGDGERTVRGEYLRLKLTPKQEALVNDITTAIEKARAAGVEFIWNADQDELYSFNGLECESIDNESVDSREPASYANCFSFAGFIEPLSDIAFKKYYTNDCDYGLSIIFKD